MFSGLSIPIIETMVFGYAIVNNRAICDVGKASKGNG
jgi:hypothetical protein